jgi:hypothetical protein
MRYRQQRAGIQEKLNDLHVIRNTGSVQIRDVVKRHTAAEQPRYQRFQKTPLQLAFPLRSPQAQGGKYLERDGGVALRAAVEFVRQWIGLAYP